MIYSCCNENRKSAVLQSPGLNGIDFLEVLDQEAIALDSPRQQTLLVYCLKAAPATLTPDNVLITGGESIQAITADWVAPASPAPTKANAAEAAYFTALPEAANVLVIRTSRAGDFSPYVLRLVDHRAQAETDPFDVTSALAGFDPGLAEVTFSFKVECGPSFDCAPAPPNCRPPPPTPPSINYLAKDYGTFRAMILDRLSQLLPGWTGAAEADLGVALAELIAYTGDYLSYQQDAVATEAYLETARSRVSLRRHAVLVDYHVQDGCNARTWIQFQVQGNPGDQVFLDRARTRCYTFAPGAPAAFYANPPGVPSPLAVGAGNEEAAVLGDVKVFEPMGDALLYPEHNQLALYTWGNLDCCLPVGATEATLAGSYPNLRPGDVLIFQEVIGPRSGSPADADPRHRAAVRLTDVATRDARGKMLGDPLFEDQTGKPITDPTQKPTPVTEIRWSSDDALPFPVCVSSTYLDSGGDRQSVSAVSVAFGNVVLADHGLSMPARPLGTVPPPRLFFPANPAADRCQITAPTPLPVRFRPTVPDHPVTRAIPLTTVSLPVPGASFAQTAALDLSASGLMGVDPRLAVPAISLAGTLDATTETWTPVTDLLESGASDLNFVLEVEADGTAAARFGDGVNGRRPDPGTHFDATYRVGGGVAGNVGADSLVYLAAADARIQACRNPLPATGGTDPETDDQIRRRAPRAFLTQERAVTLADYEDRAESDPRVQRAVASRRWTGSWYTVFIAAEPRGGGNLTSTLQRSLTPSIDRYRLAGEDLRLDSPQYVSLEIELEVCVDPSYFQSDVEQALRGVLGSQTLPNGQKGLFAPDNFTFGQTVYLSPVYAAARTVAGVVSVRATRFQPQGVNLPRYLAAGEIKLGSLQVARLENDPSFPDHGQLTLVLRGGK